MIYLYGRKNKMTNTWFTSDYHLGHANIIKYCGRPFKDVEHMNKTIITNHNNRVKHDDIVFFLGDFCFRNSKGGKEGEGNIDKAEHYLKQLNGRFVFIRGNHDNNNSLKTCIKSAVIEFGGQEIFLCHNPADCNTKYKINFVGHVHQNWKVQKVKGCMLINVGVDVNNFMPVKFDEIMSVM